MRFTPAAPGPRVGLQPAVGSVQSKQSVQTISERARAIQCAHSPDDQSAERMSNETEITSGVTAPCPHRRSSLTKFSAA